MKKLVSIVLALALVLASCAIAFAADPAYSITIDNDKDNATIIGKTYKAYKVFDLTLGNATTDDDGVTTYGAYSYSIKNTHWAWGTLTAGSTTDADTGIITTTYGIKLQPSASDATLYSIDGQDFKAANARSFADDLMKAKVLPTMADGSAEATTEKVTIPLDSAGYYAVYGVVSPTDASGNPAEEVVAALALDSTDPNATVKPKVEVPPLNKKITGLHVLDAKGQAATAEVGETVFFELTSKVPDLTGYTKYTYKITDTMSDGLTFTDPAGDATNDVKVKINYVDKTSECSITISGQTMTVVIPFNTLKAAKKGDFISVTYSAVLNDKALTTDYEKNTAKLTYSHSPYDDDENDTPEHTVFVIDVDINVDKIANGDTTKHLAGAKFKAFKGANIPADDAAAWYKWDDSKKVVTWVTKANADVFETNDDGKFVPSVKGLEADKNGTKYGLLEIEPPKGYNLLKDPVIVTLTGSLDGKTATITASGASMTNGTINFENAQSDKQPVATAQVNNQSGTELPSTGGIGTTIFYILGGLLVVGAAVILVARRKASN